MIALVLRKFQERSVKDSPRGKREIFIYFRFFFGFAVGGAYLVDSGSAGVFSL